MQITKVQYGRTRSIQKQTLLWRKRREYFEKTKDLVMDRVIHAFNGDTDAVYNWFTTPLAELNDKTPHSYYNPNRIRALHKLVKRLFKNS